jgi:hypothetical protein
MDLSLYHQNYAKKTLEDIQRRAAVKERALVTVFEKTGYQTEAYPVRVAILGCGDRRLIDYHKSMFETMLRKNVYMITFDITLEHFAGEEGIVQHDVTTPLPNAPYDLAFGDILLRFIETQKQWDVLRNSYQTLRSPGMAIHVIGKAEAESEAQIMPDGYYAVPLEEWKKRLMTEKIKFMEIPLRIEGIEKATIEETALVLIK